MNQHILSQYFNACTIWDWRGGKEISKFQIQNINKPPCHLERYHSRALHTKSGEDPTKTEGGDAIFVIRPEFPKNAQKNRQKSQTQNINNRPCHVLRDHQRQILWKFGEDPIKTEGGDRFLLFFLKFTKKIHQKSKIHQTPMSCFEGPPNEDSVKVWRRSDQNWERRCDLKLCLRRTAHGARRTAHENWCL